MKIDAKQHLIPSAIIVVGLVVMISLSTALDRSRQELPAEYADSDLALQGKKLKGYALGAEGLLADWYWMQSLQYLGGKILNSRDETIRIDDLTALNPRLLYPYLENATELDPKFTAAYSFGAIVLPGIDVEKAIELTEKGIERNPSNWRLYQYLGYIFWKRGDYAKAAATYDTGSKIAGSPPFMRQMVAAMNAAGGSRETARAIYSQMLRESEDEQSKENAKLRLHELDSMEIVEAVNRALAESKDRSGQCVQRLADILPSLRSVNLPYGLDFQIDASNNLVDPSGVPYNFDRSSCSIELARESKIPKPLK
jgi:tetratricopeptide (TPR) repeat protein